MEQFSLEKYLLLKEEGKEPKIVTRNGQSARIICTDRKNEHFPIVALVDDGDVEQLISVCKNGRNIGISEGLDLFFAPTKHEGWVNVYSKDGTYVRKIYATEDEAKENAADGCVDTVKIEWEG